MLTAVTLDDARVRKISPAMPIKLRKHSANLLQQQQQQQHGELRREPTFGICFDVDGVLARGTVAIPGAVTGFRRLLDGRGQPRVPVAFVTNSLNRNCDKAAQLSAMLGVQVTADQCIQAQGPLEVFTSLHEKHCLIVGQGKILDIADELGFKNVCTVEQIAEAYPLLDMVDHDNRRKIATQGYVEKDFPKVEAVVLLGEPKRWESALQILVDVLRSDGRPNQVPASSSYRQLPVVACNMDLQFQHSAPMPRYGHGAFLVCLEGLFKKVTGRELQYTALVGKPSEITFRYAEHVLTSQTKKLGFNQPIKTMYLIGDTPEVDIVGTNLYQRYVDRMLATRNQIDNSSDQADQGTGKDADGQDAGLPSCRNVPPAAEFHRQTVNTVVPILVRTGVYRGPASDSKDRSSSVSSSEEEDEDGSVEDHTDQRDFQGHRDFPNNAELRKPQRICDDVVSAIDYIMSRED